MRFIFYFPQPKIIEIYKNNRNIYFFDSGGMYRFKNNIKKKINLNIKSSTKILKSIDFNNMIQNISNWGPVWSRFSDRGDQYELYKREILIKSIQIINFIKRYNIKKIIMFTYISHNIQSLMFDLVSKFSNTQQIFFFSSAQLPGNKDNLIIPIIQNNSIKKRIFIKNKFSNFSFKNYLIKKKNILENVKDQELSKYKSYYEEYYYSRNFLLSFLKIFVYYSYANARKKLIDIFNKKKIFLDVMNYSVITHLKQVYQQNQSFKFYRNNQTSLNNSDNKKYLLIVSHTQPEAASYPVGQEWNNHIDMILEIRKKGYLDKIFYKEHATNFNYYDKIIHHGRKGSNRSKNYYKNLMYLNTALLPENINIFSKILLNKFLPVTISGTVAIERSLLGLKTIYFGYPWWRGMPGTIHISKIKKLNKIENFFKKEKKISLEAIKFICNKLDYKTIENFPEMHSLKNDHKYDKLVFKRKFDQLLKNLSNLS